MARNNKKRAMLLRWLADTLENNTWYLGEPNEAECKALDTLYSKLTKVYDIYKHRAESEILAAQEEIPDSLIAQAETAAGM